MPGFDGTGPAGNGLFTGRGMGYCIIKVDYRNHENQNNKGKEVFDMPRGDGTGPMGLGPMTGRAAGYCGGFARPGYMNQISGRGRGFGFGRGWGQGRGWGRGRGRRFGWFGYGSAPYYGDPDAPEVTPQQEAEMLKKEAKAMQEEIDAMNQRAKNLESIATSESNK